MSDRLKELREKQAKIVADARAILDAIKDDTPEAEAKEAEGKYDKAMAEYDRLDALAQREEKLAEKEAAINAPDPRRPNVDDRAAPSGQNENEKVDVKKAFVRAMQFGTDSLSVAERHAVAQLRTMVTPEMRAQGTTSGAVGAFTIPEGFLPEIEK